MRRIIDRYVLREVFPPFLIGLLLIAFVLLMNQVLLVADLFIDKGVPVLSALRLLGLLVPSILVFALPMAVLMGILGGLARLSADSEIVALASVGVGPRRLARPLALFGLAGYLATLPLALWWAPRANDAWVRDMTASVLGRVRLKVEPLEFNETLPGMVFLVREVGPDKAWRDVFVDLGRGTAEHRVVLARSGTVRFYPGERRAILDLADGLVYAGPAADPGRDTLTSFARLEEEIDVEGLFPAVSSGKRVREKDIGELLRDLRALQAAGRGGKAPDPRQVRAHRIEVHKKFALPAACLVFALLGLPLGVMTGRTGRTGGFSLALVLILFYYVLLTAGEQAAMDGRISAALGLWAPDLVLAAAAGGLFLRARRGRSGFPRRDARAPAPAPAAAGPSRPIAAAGPAAPAPRSSGRAGLSFRFPGLLDRYVSRKFLALLGLVLAALALAACLVAFFDGLDEALRHGRSVGLLAGYVLFRLPEWLAFLLPVAVLAAALLALGALARTNEATAMKAAGVSAYRAALPVVVLAAAAAGLGFLVQERLVPASHARAESAWSALNGLPARSAGPVDRHWALAGRGDRIYHFEHFDAASSTLGRLSVFEIDAARWVLVRRVYAEKAVFDGDGLVCGDGWTRNYGGADGPAFVRAPAGRLDAAGDREVFFAPWREPLRMTYRDLRRYAREVRAMGFPAARLRAELAQKVALPFVSLIMALLAVPFGLGAGRRGTLVGVGLSVVLAMAYWGAFALLRSLGAAGVVSPFLGAWGANLVFGLAGVVGLFKLRT